MSSSWWCGCEWNRTISTPRKERDRPCRRHPNVRRLSAEYHTASVPTAGISPMSSEVPVRRRHQSVATPMSLPALIHLRYAKSRVTWLAEQKAYRSPVRARATAPSDPSFCVVAGNGGQVGPCCRHLQRSVWERVGGAASRATGVRSAVDEVDERCEELVGFFDLGEVPGPGNQDELCVGHRVE
jgi:hypothetical protein